MNIPNDPIMLMSYMNTQLRDNYASMEEFAASNGVNAQEIKDKLAAVGYKYDEEKNQFGRII